jgi:hypothetical protein
MRNVKNMFDDEYQGMGPVSLDKLSLVQTQEAEREKQRKLKRYLDNQKRNKKVLEANLDVPQLTDSMVSESSPSMVEQSAEKLVEMYSNFKGQIILHGDASGDNQSAQTSESLRVQKPQIQVIQI